MRRLTGKRCTSLLLAVALVLAAVMAAGSGCGGEGKTIVFAATTDLEESGILQAWAEGFLARSGRRVELVVVSDEQALAMARHGECDIVLTHAYDGEEYLVRTGFIDEWREVMRDDYVLAGPPQDPAAIRDTQGVERALARIASEGWEYVLLSGGSGAASMQSYLFGISGVEEAGEWLLVVEGGTDEALRAASRGGAYTLAPRSDFMRLANELDLEVLLEGDDVLANPYRVAMVSAMVYPDTDTAGAQEFITYLLSEDARRFLQLGAWVPPAE